MNRLSKLDVHQFYAIEIEEFPARIAEVALWLTDHQANAASQTIPVLASQLASFVPAVPTSASPATSPVRVRSYRSG